MTAWVSKRLSEVTSKIGSGATPLGGETAYKENGIALIRSLNVHDGSFRSKDLAFLDQVQASRLDNVIVESGDILLNITGASVARCCLVPEEVLPARVNQHVAIVRPLQNLLLPKFLQYMLVSRDCKDRLLHTGESAGSTRQALTKAQLQDFVVRFPESINEQRRIVTLLDEAFADIATAKANYEKNLQNARELFESHLQRLFAQRGEGWKDKTLAEISTTFGRGKSRHRPRNDPALYGGQYPFVQTGDVRNAEHIITEFSQTYSEAGLAQSKLWPKGTICITIAANIAETGILGFDACFPDSVIGVVPDPKEADIGYVEYVLQSFKARLQALGQGSAQANINMGTFENERFPFPSVTEQRSIVTKLDALSEESQRLESIYRQKLTALEDLKKSLLHQAFSGFL